MAEFAETTRQSTDALREGMRTSLKEHPQLSPEEKLGLYETLTNRTLSGFLQDW